MTHRVDSRVRVNLQSVDVVPGILEQSVVWIQHLMRQKVEPLPADEQTEREEK